MRKTHTVPTFVALIALVGVILGLSFGGSTVTQLFSRASNDGNVSDNLVVTNVDDLGWTVVWTTPNPVSGVVFYGGSANLGDGIASDDREITVADGKYKTHSVSVKVSSAGKKYFCLGDNPSSVDIKTCPKKDVEIPVALSGNRNVDPAYGKVVNDKGEGVSGALVILEISGAQKMSAVTKNDGTFVIPLLTLRNADMSQFFSVEGSVNETLTVIAPDLSKTVVSCTYGPDKPLPNVVLGKSGDCATLAQMPAPQAVTTTPTPTPGSNNNVQVANVSPTPTPTTTVSNTGNKFKTVKINSNNTVNSTSGTNSNQPLNISEGQVLDNSLPTFSGKVRPGDIINVVVHSTIPFSGTIRAAPDGSWSWTPPANLEPGQHTVTLTITLANGTKQTVNRSFTVTPGVDILPITSGTPSASIATPTPTDYPTPTQAVRPTITPYVTGETSLSFWVVVGGLILLLGGAVSLL